MSNEKTTDYSILLPPEPVEGGLIKPLKKNPNIDESFEFRAPMPISDKPRVSLLGLDRLAAAKKKEKLLEQNKESEEPTSKRSKVYSYKTGIEEPMEEDLEKESSQNKVDMARNYRERDDNAKTATPTPHRLYHENYKDKKHGSSSHTKGIYASSNKNGMQNFFINLYILY